MTAIDVVRPEDLAIDHELADTASSIRFLLDVTPVNLLEERHRFLEEGRTPEFIYGPLEDDPAVIQARLAGVAEANVEDPALAKLLHAKRRELELELQMLRCRGSAEFLPLSIELYGTVSPALHAEAEVLLDRITVPPPERDDRLSAEEFARRADAELDHYRAVDPDISAIVELRTDSSGIMVSNGNLLIAPTAVVPARRVDALLQHEVGTHIVTHVNGSRQPLRLLGAGLAGCDETQEGLAVLVEWLVGGLTPRRLRQLAARVVAVHRMTQGDRFPDVHSTLVASGVAPIEAFTITMRVFRSGGLTKDAVYLRGLGDVVAHVAAGRPLDVLWLGKMSLADVPLVEDFRRRGVLSDPVLTPRFLTDPEVHERLARISTTTTLFDLIGGPA